MTPIPKENSETVNETPHGDSVVISGASTSMPGCENLMEFGEKLYKKETLTKHDKPRWRQVKHPEMPQHTGLIKGISKFDAQYFKVNNSLAHSVDTNSRKLLEHSFQAIFDSGTNPSEFWGKRVGVFIAAGICEGEGNFFLSQGARYGIVGCSRAMFSNRISYYLNLNGPSVTIDALSCGSVVVLQEALNAINTGLCEAAIVGSSTIVSLPHSAIMWQRNIPYSTDGKVKSYDSESNGLLRSEGVNVILLQKYKDAKRVYAQLSHAKCEAAFCGTNGLVTNPLNISRFLGNFYQEAGVRPDLVEYVDGFGIGVPDIDKVELQAIGDALCKERSNPLLMGSIMSSIGFTETCSALSSVMKLILAYQKGEIAGNINCENPRKDIDFIRDGRLQIVTDNQAFGKTYTAVNSFSLSGLVGHALLKGHYKPKVLSKYKSDLPYLVVASGRQESSVEKILVDIGSRQIDPEEISLLHNFFKLRISQHLAKGYGIFSIKDDKTVVQTTCVDYYDEVKRPLWFIYSGMGSQWAGMGVDLMCIPTFAATIQRCHKVLESRGVDLIKIITTPDEKIFDNILNSFVGIAAIQIGLTDVLQSIGLVPDNIIGHSVGELGCAYADGCFTAEEMILMSYFRGLVSIETKFIHGSMAAVGLGYKQISKLCPAETEVACRNGPGSCTISGPSEDVAKFVKTLTARGIFAKEVKCSNIAYHSRYIAEAGPKLLKLMKTCLKEPKLRSKRWISTSVPQEKWTEPSALYSSAEYHTNNLLNPVLFEDMLRYVPSNAVMIEIAPHGLLQAILKRSLSPDCKHIPLTRRGDADNAVNVLKAIGKIYMAGFEVDLNNLYPKIEFPVSTVTRTMSHLVDWVHTETWSTWKYVGLEKNYNAVYKQTISILDDDYSYLAGNAIEGMVVYPFAAALVSAWDTLAMITNKKRREESVVFQDVWLYDQPRLTDSRSRHITVQLQRGSGHFEVTHENGVIAEGYVIAVSKVTSTVDLDTDDSDSMDLSSDEIYKLFSARGYEYSDQFQSISKANLTLTKAKLTWQDNWVILIDSLLQLYTLNSSHDGVSQPHFIKHIGIDFKKTQLEILNSKNRLGATFDPIRNLARCGGVMIQNVIFKDKLPLVKHSITLNSPKFVPFNQDGKQDINTTFYVYMKIISENLNKSNLTILNISDTTSSEGNIDIINNVNDLMDDIKINITNLLNTELYDSKIIHEKPDVVLIGDLLLDKEIFEALFHRLPRNVFIISRGVNTSNMYPSSLYRRICSAGIGTDRVELARWRFTTPTSMTTAITIQSKSDIKYLESVRNNLSKNQKLLINTPKSIYSDLKPMVQKWRDNSEHNNISLAIIDKTYFEEQEMTDLSNLDLAFNVLNNGVWGGEYYIPTTAKGVTIDNFALKVTRPGDLTSLNWIQTPEINDGIMVTVLYGGLNCNDANRAASTHLVNNDQDGFGMDFSGVSGSGERVMGLVKCGAVSRRVRAHPKLLWPVPKHWSLEDAATVPLAYAHAFYCLAIKSKLYPGMRVLIHGGAGALGQAAIAIALEYKCHVFTTVSDIKKKHFLKKLFPELKENHIGNSRDETFGDMVMCLTNQVGCDVIISCVRGRLKTTTLKCCAASGVTIDTAHVANPENYDYGLFNMTRSRTYCLADFSSILTNENYENMAKLQFLVSEGIARGYVKPLSRVTYAANDAARAFKLLSASNHRGRVLLHLRDFPQAQPRIICTPERYQLIITDKEELGIQLADRLIRCGAKKLYINCPNSTNYLTYKRSLWMKLDVDVQISSVNLNLLKSVQVFFKNVGKLGSPEGVFVTTIGIAESEKSSILVNLDLVSRKMWPDIKYFAVINDDTVGQDIILDRDSNGLPSHMLILHHDQKQGNNDNMGVQNLRSILNAFEEALCSKDAIVHAHIRPLNRLLEEITNISGFVITNSIKDNVKLEEIGIDYNKAEELHNVLKDRYNITVSGEILPNMTINEFQNLEKQILDDENNLVGFHSFCNTMDTDELCATADFMQMDTFGISGMALDDLDKDLTYLCIVPGLEGHYKRFNSLCETLKIPTVVLQPGIDHPGETISESAERMVEVITKKLQIVKKHFYLVGYEFGVVLVLEMAAILESRGFTASVYLLGGTPNDMQDYLEMHLNTVKGGHWVDALILHMATVILGKESPQLLEQLINYETCEDKVEYCIKILRPNVKYTSEYIRKQIETSYHRIIMMRNWTMKLKPLNSKIIILRAIMPNALSKEELKMFSNVEVYNIPSNVAQTSQDLTCAAIINRTLSPEILEDFNNKNHCDITVLNESVFVMKIDHGV